MTTPNGQQAAPRVALIIPTVHTRIQSFSRTLAYLAQCRYGDPIVVSDHSPPERAAPVADALRRHPELDITLVQHPPDLHFLKRLADCAAKVDTPYVHLHADDDFILPSTLALLVKAMERDPGCAAATGIHMNVWVRELASETLEKFAYPQRDPGDRLIAQLVR